MTDKPKTVYQELREINVNEHAEKKNGFNYLSWAWALDVMYNYDHDATFAFPEREVFQDGTVMIYCDVSIKGKTKRGFLPVMDYKNQPIKNPNAFAVNTAMQRCLVKTIALHGLGLSIYAGEDLPQDEVKQEPQIQDNSAKKETAQEVKPKETMRPKKELTPEEQETATRLTTIKDAILNADSVKKIDLIWNNHTDFLMGVKEKSPKTYSNIDQIYLDARKKLDDDEIPTTFPSQSLIMAG